MNDELNISLEPHLREVLIPLFPLLPVPITTQLREHLNSQNSSGTIPYSLLHSISQWSRTPPGLAALQNSTPPLSPHSYSMVSLLAGTTTSPERNFPAYVPPDPHADRKRELSDRKAVTAVVNALLSIGGSGIATWWAAERWKSEWRVLLALLVAVVVAASETILYIIWQSRRSSDGGRKVQRLKHKKDDGDRDKEERPPVTQEQETPDGLRRRAALTAVE